MVESSEVCNTMFICGNVNGVTERFNVQTTINQVNDYVRQSFQNHLPDSYRIVYYDSRRMLMTDLENQFQNGSNPFQINSSDSVRSSTAMTECLRLYIVANRSSRKGKNESFRK